MSCFTVLWPTVNIFLRITVCVFISTSAFAQRTRLPIAVMETAFGKRGDITSLADAKSAGYHAIQMHSGQPANFKNPIDQSIGLEIGNDVSLVDKWAAEAKESGVQIVSLCAGSLNKCQIWDRDREVAMRIAKQTIDACQRLEAPIMLFPFFGPSKFQESEGAFNGVANFLRELLPYAEQRGVTIGIEAPVTTVRVLELMERLEFPKHLKIYYDTGNLFAKEDIYETIRRYGKQHFCEIHIKAAGDAVAGQGQIDLAKLAQALGAAEYDNWLVYEANRNGRDPVANRIAMENLVSLRSKPARKSTQSIFEKDNLVAWCIVPFDAKQREPAARAAMVRRLGLSRVAYDWRAEHVPTFEAEILQYKKHGIEFFAFWDWHDSLAELIQKHGITPQIWKTSPSPAGASRGERIERAARALLPLVEKTKKLGLKLGLYNHGGWGGEPANLIAICRYLRREHDAAHVGIVYNLHHAHHQMESFANDLQAMKPFLLCLNLNGMVSPAELNVEPRKKIQPIGAKPSDAEILRRILESGYDGRIGIIDHRKEMDAEESLQQNINGLLRTQTGR